MYNFLYRPHISVLLSSIHISQSCHFNNQIYFTDCQLEGQRPFEEGSRLDPVRQRQDQEGLHPVRLAAVLRVEPNLGQQPDQEVSGDAVRGGRGPGSDSFGSQISEGLHRQGIQVLKV
jgi:hypothetical protein